MDRIYSSVVLATLPAVLSLESCVMTLRFLFQVEGSAAAAVGLERDRAREGISKVDSSRRARSCPQQGQIWSRHLRDDVRGPPETLADHQGSGRGLLGPSAADMCAGIDRDR